MEHFFRDVPKVGNVAVSRHAQENAAEQKITEHDFRLALFEPTRRVSEGFNTVWLERGGIRLVLIPRPEPFRGAALITTAYRLKEHEFVSGKGRRK